MKHDDYTALAALELAYSRLLAASVFQREVRSRLPAELEALQGRLLYLRTRTANDVWLTARLNVLVDLVRYILGDIEREGDAQRTGDTNLLGDEWTRWDALYGPGSQSSGEAA